MRGATCRSRRCQERHTAAILLTAAQYKIRLRVWDTALLVISRIRNSTQHRFGTDPSPHLSVPDEPKNAVPTQGGFHVDRDAPGMKHLGCATLGVGCSVASLLYLAFLPLLSLLVAWRVWTKTGHNVAGVRKHLFVVGGLTTSLAVLIYLAFSIETFRRHGWFSDLSDFTLWLRVGLWTSVAGLGLSCFGKGKSRAWTIIVAALLLALWLVMAWAPA